MAALLPPDRRKTRPGVAATRPRSHYFRNGEEVKSYGGAEKLPPPFRTRSGLALPPK